MNKKADFQKQLDNLLQEIGAAPERPSLLLHACCGPCSSYVLEYLSSLFDITVLFYNPNIYPVEEYERRLQELLNFYKRFVPAENVQVIQAPYDPEEFYTATRVRENPQLAQEGERGERCRRCYELRLRYTYDYACAHNFDYFCTTLSISPFKDAQMINEIGEALQSVVPKVPAVPELVEGGTGVEGSQTNGSQWLPSDFKKRNGFKRSLELSTEYNLYRQEYCGCVYSK